MWPSSIRSGQLAGILVNARAAPLYFFVCEPTATTVRSVLQIVLSSTTDNIQIERASESGTTTYVRRAHHWNRRIGAADESGWTSDPLRPEERRPPSARAQAALARSARVMSVRDLAQEARRYLDTMPLADMAREA